MYLRGRRIGWHALNARFEFFNLSHSTTRINPLSSKKEDSDKILLEAFTILFLTFMLDIYALAPLCKFKAVDVSTGVMKSDTVCSRYALNNLKQYDAAYFI